MLSENAASSVSVRSVVFATPVTALKLIEASIHALNPSTIFSRAATIPAAAIADESVCIASDESFPNFCASLPASLFFCQNGRYLWRTRPRLFFCLVEMFVVLLDLTAEVIKITLGFVE